MTQKYKYELRKGDIIFHPKYKECIFNSHINGFINITVLSELHMLKHGLGKRTLRDSHLELITLIKRNSSNVKTKSEIIKPYSFLKEDLIWHRECFIMMNADAKDEGMTDLEKLTNNLIKDLWKIINEMYYKSIDDLINNSNDEI